MALGAVMASSFSYSSPNPHAPAFRPAPIRSNALGPGPAFKSRAASQPAGERLPAPGSQPDSGRGSPGNAGAFGVIGGSRTPSRFVNAMPTGGTATRANSFSAGEMREPRVSHHIHAKLNTESFTVADPFIPCGGTTLIRNDFTVSYILAKFIYFKLPDNPASTALTSSFSSESRRECVPIPKSVTRSWCSTGTRSRLHDANEHAREHRDIR